MLMLEMKAEGDVSHDNSRCSQSSYKHTELSGQGTGVHILLHFHPLLSKAFTYAPNVLDKV